jgi:uncharacterized protein
VKPPFPLVPVSNGEWMPLPPDPRQRQAARLLAEEAAVRARRLGLTRTEFLRTAAGTMTAFMVLNRVHGLDAWGDDAVLPVRAEACADPEAAAHFLSDRWFVMDVQLHHVDLTLPMAGDAAFVESNCGLRFLDTMLSCPERLALLGQATFMKEVLVDSETDVGVISGLPGAAILPVETMAATRDLGNQLAGGTQRLLSQALVDPLAPPGTSLAVDSLEHQVRDLGASALKLYTSSGDWRLDDERVSYPMLERAEALGLRIVNVHKGLGAVVHGKPAPSLRSDDLPAALRDFPNLRFVAYHAGYNLELRGNKEFIDVVRALRHPARRHLYAEIGTAFAAAFLDSPRHAAHLMGRLLALVGSHRILWGTDSIWWGSPQWQIEAFKRLRIPRSMQERYGYPPLGRQAKRRILGGNAARLYRIDRKAPRCAVSPEALAAFTATVAPGLRLPAARTLRAYGPRTRREFLALLRQESTGRG